jgi:hypothetical protein
LAIPVLLILAVLWALVLVPWLRDRATGRRDDSIGDFNYRLGVIGRTGGHPLRRSGAMRAVPNRVLHPARAVRATPARPGAPMPRTGGTTPLQRRRRDVLVTLLCVAAATFVLAALSNEKMMWYVQMLADALVAGYVALLVAFKRQTMERHAKVSYLPQRAAPQLAGLRRTGSS